MIFQNNKEFMKHRGKKIGDGYIDEEGNTWKLIALDNDDEVLLQKEKKEESEFGSI